MIRFRNFLPAGMAALFGAALLALPAQAQAGFTLTIAESGGPSVTVTDNGAGDLDSRSGVINFSSGVGDFNIQSDIGTSNSPGTQSLARLSINNLSISSNGFAGNKTLTITLVDTGFTAPTGNTSLESQLSTTQLPADSTVTFQSFLNGNPGTLLTLNTVDGTRTSDAVSIAGPFTLANVTTITVHGRGIGTELDVQTTGLSVVAPAPQGLMLVLTAIPALGVVGLYYRRRHGAPAPMLA